jgi:hypothetical protein
MHDIPHIVGVARFMKDDVTDSIGSREGDRIVKIYMNIVGPPGVT